jgi:hypothetical protein
MFIFASTDDECPKARKKRLRYELIKYYSGIYKSKREIARQSGIAHRTFYDTIKNYPDLNYLLPRKRRLTRYDKKELWKIKKL